MDERLRVSVDNLLEGIQVIDRQWRYVYLNTTAAMHAQRPAGDLLDRTMMECFPGIETTDLFRALTDVMDSRRPRTMRNEFTYPTGERRWFELVIDPVPDGICVLSLDITDRRRIELELHHAQRMDALGKLAGGIAHDFNNQLAAILGFTELLLETAQDEGQQRDLNEIRNAATRSAALTRQLLAFSRRQVLKVEPLDLNALVRDMGRLLERVLGEDVTCEFALRDTPVPILADAQQLENALTNLAVNARDAMPEGGHLTISTTVEQLAPEDVRLHAMMSPGSYAVLSVIDTGCGMDEDTKARVFEPFFTTKDRGKGTGLGLATVYGIVKQMSGFIWVYSELGHGTAFRMYFPCTTAPQPRTTPQPARARLPHRPASILVIEDDEHVRDFTTRALSANGYTVLEAANGADARRQIQARTTPLDLILADVILPGTSGPELIPQLGVGNAKVLFMSGYSEAHIENRGLGDLTLLEKPFTVRDLLQAVGHALADR